MKYIELFSEVKRFCAGADVSAIDEHIAVQFDVTGNACGAFYMEVLNGRLYVEPYDYHDRDASVKASAEVILDVMIGKMSTGFAVEQCLVEISGDIRKVIALRNALLK